MHVESGRIELTGDEMATVLRSETPAERTAIAANLWEYERNFVVAAMRRQNPEWDEESVQREFLRRFLR